MRDVTNVVFVEVRYRARNRFADGLCSVDEYKQARLVKAAACYLAANPVLADCPVRFDVVALDGNHGRGHTIKWLKDAFRP